MLLATFIVLIGTITAPIGVYFELDPIFVLLNKFCPDFLQNDAYKCIAFFHRCIWLQWCALEASRIYVLLFLPVLATCNSYVTSFIDLHAKPFGNEVIHLYNICHCVYQIGKDTISLIAGLIMALGIMLLVELNSLLICCYYTLPIEVYLLIVCFAAAAYFVLFQTLPLIIKCDYFCTTLINAWKFKIYDVRGCQLFWVKKVKAQRPVSVYYALTKFEQSTKRNVYSTILDSTINVVLLF